MNFGMNNAPSTFMIMMISIFREDLGKHVVICLYNIIVFSKKEDKHILDLQIMLNKLRTNEIYAEPSKCEFFRTSITFLGHVISSK